MTGYTHRWPIGSPEQAHHETVHHLGEIQYMVEEHIGRRLYWMTPSPGTMMALRVASQETICLLSAIGEGGSSLGGTLETV
jgi:hypothetical protein